ncbi:hypothetical protein [Leptodesmis sichuanensis]|uniref:hypothetical protein n=1 Tax=Leptodesmis sichuanensis TaxID=2906798 RepID=UPI001F21F988|nr:hypothetical protein [Leptodesmis sichuanensis]UIE36282.1 transposase [Leptodesmis sichuanensis A121]
MKQARALVMSSDFITYETLQVRNMIRNHICSHCGSVRCRDENAAWNILEKGLRLAGINTVGHTEINASGQNDLYLSQAIGLDKSAG